MPETLRPTIVAQLIPKPKHPSTSVYFNWKKKDLTMADDGDYVIEVSDAGASATIPMEAGQVKKGG